MDIKKVLKQITAIQKKESDLTEWEKDFIKSLAERAEKYGETLNISDKQAAVISRIFDQRVEGIDDRKTGKVESTPAGNPFPQSDELPA